MEPTLARILKKFALPKKEILFVQLSCILRKTNLTEDILRILQDADTPLTVSHIRDLLESEGKSPNKTTVYRQLENMESQGVIYALMLQPNLLHYELSGDHHHHFVCDSCDMVECVHDDKLESAIHHLEKDLGDHRTIVQHHFHVSGVCQDCQK